MTTEELQIKALMREILISNNRPIKNTTKEKCYEVLAQIQELLGTNRGG